LTHVGKVEHVENLRGVKDGNYVPLGLGVGFEKFVIEEAGFSDRVDKVLRLVYEVNVVL
jgi:hypothetical protein